jgi:hypothetical protein
LGKELATIACGKSEWVRSAAFSPDGKFVAGVREIEGGFSTMLVREILIWEAATGRLACRIDTHAGSMAFSPDGRYLYVSAGSWTSFVWDLNAGQEVGRLGGHSDGRMCFAVSPDGRFVVTAGSDHSALVWDARAVTARHVPPAPLGSRGLTMWANLADDQDAAGAFRAIGGFADQPAATIALFRERLKPALPPDRDEVARLIADLDDQAFPRRERAEKELVRLGDVAGPAVREALRISPSAEARRRLQGILARLESSAPTPEQLRAIRATAVLERIGTAEADELLREWASGTAGARLTREAKAALERRARLR